MKKYVKLIKTNDSIAILLPKEIEKELGITINSPISLTTSRNKIILNIEISKTEMEILKKLLNLKFEERTEKNVNSMFTAAQKKIINDLIKRKVITLYKGKKYKEAVYNIPDKIYEILIKFGVVKKKKSEEEKRKNKEIEMTTKEKIKKFMEKGYIVIEDHKEAEEISKEIENKIKEKKLSRGEFKALKGFDKKYYLIKTNILKSYSQKIINSLKDSEKSAEELQKELKLDKDLICCLLAALNEEGEIIEKRRGVFSLG